METIVFLCNGEAEYYSEKGIIKNRELPDLIKSVISSGIYYITSWSCANSKFIQVGDRAYLQRSGNMGNEPSGFIAAGHVIPAPENKQLRLLNSKYSVLSEAYIYDYDGCFAVNLQIDSIVDFDFPLEQRDLKKQPQFQGVNFNFGKGGCRIDSNAANSLDSEWEKHSLIKQREGRGRRLVDFFFEQGESFKQKKEYKKAIDAYKLALEIDPKYMKATYRIETCVSNLEKEIIIPQKPFVEPKLPELSPNKDEL